jgi:hypothetical protein
VSCTNPFTTRESEIEEPDISDQSDIFDQPVASETVMSNFRYSLVQKNISNYMNCFVDPSLAYSFTFRFIHDPSIESIKFINWNLDDERDYLNTVFNQSGNISLEYIDNISFTNITQSPDSVQTSSFQYELRIAFDDGDVIYSGTARMKLIKNVNALWSIYYWEDLKALDIDSKSWSNLKANYKN